MNLASKHESIFYTALAFQNVQNIFSKPKTGGAVPLDRLIPYLAELAQD
jgi:hypothetical protein